MKAFWLGGECPDYNEVIIAPQRSRSHETAIHQRCLADAAEQPRQFNYDVVRKTLGRIPGDHKGDVRGPVQNHLQLQCRVLSERTAEIDLDLHALGSFGIDRIYKGLDCGKIGGRAIGREVGKLQP